MKKFMLLLSAVIINGIFFGQDTLKVKSEIDAVTVYKEGTQNGVDIENLKATSEFYRKRMKEIELEILFYNNKIKSFNKEIVKISRQLNELNVKREYTTSEIVVVLSAKNKLRAKLKFEYFIKKAGWIPYYDIRVADVNNPVKVIYKVKIYQNSRYLVSSRKESRAWKISVKNMKKYPIKLVVEDQLPIPGNNKRMNNTGKNYYYNTVLNFRVI